MRIEIPGLQVNSHHSWSHLLVSEEYGVNVCPDFAVGREIPAFGEAF